MNVTSNSIMDILLFTNLRAVLLVVLAIGFLAVVRTESGSLRHMVWLAVISGCLLFPLVSAIVPTLSIPLLPAEAPVSAGAEAAGAIQEMQSAGAEAARPDLKRGFRVLLGIYIAGMLALLGNFANSIVRLARFERSMRMCSDRQLLALKDALCRELEISRPVRLLESDSANSPFTWGARRPRVVLPVAACNWSAESKANVLRHEIYHVKRFDWPRLCLQQLAAALYWFNPFVWLAVRQCRYEAERACDDFVLESGGNSVEYAEQLVDLMASSRKPTVSAVALGDGDFVRRIRAILKPTNEVRVMSKLKQSIATVGVAASVVILAACQVTNGQSPETERERQPAEQIGRQTGQQGQQGQQGQPAQQAQPAQPAQQAQQGQQGNQPPRQSERRIVEDAALSREAELLRMRAQVYAREQEMLALSLAREANARRVQVARERAEQAGAASAGSALTLEQQRERILVMAQEVEKQEVALRENQEQLLRQERVLQELSESLNRQADILVSREREVAARQRALAEAEADTIELSVDRAEDPSD